MRRSVRDLIRELERHGVRVRAGGELQWTGEAPPDLLLRAHRNRRALAAAAR